MKTRSLLCLVAVALWGCTESGTPESQIAQTNSTFSDAVTEFVVHIFYENGAEPYTGNIGVSGNDTWDITKESYKALFSQHTGRTVTVPSTTGAMTELADQGKASWTADELLSLGEAQAPALTDGTKINVSIVFLNGKYNGEDTVLGIHFSGRRFAFVFKDVVQGVGGTGADQRYVEQSTVVHELGHVVGFVNNGVPMVANHEDSEHPKHTTNQDCVMYWAVESSTQILSSLTDFITGNTLNLFAAEVLQDGRAYHP